MPNLLSIWAAKRLSLTTDSISTYFRQNNNPLESALECGALGHIKFGNPHFVRRSNGFEKLREDSLTYLSPSRSRH